jgi:hypothetical protein
MLVGILLAHHVSLVSPTRTLIKPCHCPRYPGYIRKHVGAVCSPCWSGFNTSCERSKTFGWVNPRCTMHMHARVYGVFAHTHCEYTYVCLSYLCQKTLQLPNFSRLISWSGVCVSYVSVEFWSGRFWVGHAHGYGHGTVWCENMLYKASSCHCHDGQGTKPSVCIFSLLSFNFLMKLTVIWWVGDAADKRDVRTI